MKVLTKYPIYVNKKKVSSGDFYMNVDANNVAQIKAFQNWMDIKYPTWYSGGKMNKDVSKGYGTYNDATKSADNTYGKEFEAVLMQTSQTISPALETATGVSKGVFSGTFTPKQEIAKQEVPNEKNKMKKGTKMALIIGGSVVGIALIGFLIYKISK